MSSLYEAVARPANDDFFEKIERSDCKHAEDVCQDCLEEKIQFILEKTDVILKRLLIRGKNKNPLPPELDVAFHDLLRHDCSRLEQQRESAVDVLDRWGRLEQQRESAVDVLDRWVREDIRVNSHQSLSACDEETKARGKKNAEAEASR